MPYAMRGLLPRGASNAEGLRRLSNPKQNSSRDVFAKIVGSSKLTAVVFEVQADSCAERNISRDFLVNLDLPIVDTAMGFEFGMGSDRATRLVNAFDASVNGAWKRKTRGSKWNKRSVTIKK